MKQNQHSDNLDTATGILSGLALSAILWAFIIGVFLF